MLNSISAAGNYSNKGIYSSKLQNQRNVNFGSSLTENLSNYGETKRSQGFHEGAELRTSYMIGYLNSKIGEMTKERDKLIKQNKEERTNAGSKEREAYQLYDKILRN